MSILGKFFNKTPESTRYQMITETGNGFYMWDGKLFQSDIIRSCIRPMSKAIGKLVAKHIRTDKTGISVNPDAYLRFLLEEPNPYMTGQVMQEKLATQLALNNNAFAVIMRDDLGCPAEIYPVPATMVETIYSKNATLFLKFYFKNGRQSTFPYTDIIHLRQDFNDNDIFGDDPTPALTSLMEIVSVSDQGIVKAIKNSNVIKWLLKYSASMRPEDLQKEAKKFVDNYLSSESTTIGVAAVDSKADATRVEPKDYVPNALALDRVTQRIRSFFNTNDNIVQSKYTEDQWNAYYEAIVEPIAVQLSGQYTVKIFSRRERGFGNKVMFETSNLQFASLSTKLALLAMVDRGAMTPNEWREALGLAPLEGGNEPIRRLDTAVVSNKYKFANSTTNSNTSKVYAIDFDGTLCENYYPNIGAEKNNVIDYVKNLKIEGHKLILWTCRSGEALSNAEAWCEERGIEFDGINENLKDILDKYGEDSRKITADYYIDDKAINVSDISK